MTQGIKELITQGQLIAENNDQNRSENIKILLLRPVLDAYGVSKILRELADGLLSKGHSVVLASDNRDKFKVQIEDRGIRHYSLPLRPDRKNMFTFIVCLLRIARIVHKEKINIIHSHHRWSSFISYFVSRILNVPLVTTYHGIHDGKKHLSLWGDRIISVSEDARNHLIEYFGVDEACIEVIHNGISIPEEKDDFVTRTTSPENDPTSRRPVIGNIARLSPEKDQETLLFAMKKILVKHPEVRLLIVGDGPLEKELRELSEKIHISGNVHFLGEVEDISEILRNIDLLVLSSLSEGLPLAVLEALAFSKPVVATSVGDIPKIVINGKTGYTVTPRDPEQLADAIDMVLSNRDIARVLGRNGRELVKNKFSVEWMTDRNENVYHKVMAAL